MWNEQYCDQVRRRVSDRPPARSQKIYALSVKSNKILRKPVERVHYDKNLGVAEITRESAEEFARRHHSDSYDDFVRENADAHYPIYMDFEGILTGIEKLPPYTALLDVGTTGEIRTVEQKAFMGCFVVLQFLRSHAIMNAMVQWQDTLQHPKFEHFMTLKWFLSDTEALFRLVHPLVACRWVLYKALVDTFPLCDSPVLIHPSSIMVSLSPRVLLEIERTVPASQGEWCSEQSVPDTKVDEFRRRTIANTFREVIFSDRQVLQNWQSSSEFRKRVELMKDTRHYNKIVRDEGQHELWLLNAYANRS